MQALLSNARAKSPVAKHSQDADKGAQSWSLLPGWIETPARQTYVQAYTEGELMPLSCCWPLTYALLSLLL